MKIKTAFLLTMLTAGLPESAFSQAIVVPNANATVEGDALLASAPFNNSSRYQQIYGASQFGSAPVFITQIAFRPDSAQPSAISQLITQFRIDLSTTSLTVANLSSTFANNLGANNTTVFNAPITLTSSNLAGPGNTKQFDTIFTLTTPFLYNPALGNLLMDLRNFGASGNTFYDGQIDASQLITRLVFADGSPSSTTGTVQGGGLVTEFITVAVPEPSTIALISLSGVGILVVTGRKYFCRQEIFDRKR